MIFSPFSRFVGCAAIIASTFFVQPVFAQQTLEAENLTRTSSAIGTAVATNQSGASNSAFVYLNEAAALNDWMEFTLPNITAGTYNIKIYYKTNYNRAIFQGAVDGTALGGTRDQYAATAANQVLFDMGNRALTAGNHQLRMTVTGKISSSTAYVLTLDKIIITPVVAPPAINTQPANRSVNLGQTAAFSITATGSGTLTYQWRKNGTNISGATATTYTTPATTAADNGAQFSCVVSNASGSTTSNNAILTVTSNTPPAITTQPVSQTVAAGQTATFSVTVSGTTPITYQWRKNSSTISGATSASYTTPAAVIADNGALFSCYVSNSYGNATSNNATLTVQTDLRRQDSLALVAFYNSTGGSNWTTRTNWLTAQPIDTWFGVTVTNGRVAEININNPNNITGILPPEIGNLSALTVLAINSQSQLGGTIPREIGNCLNLIYLMCSGNNFTGKIPSEIGNLVKLEGITLKNNQLSDTLPSSIGNLAKVVVLDLQHNQFAGNIPPSLGNISTLQSIFLNSNHLSGTLPASLVNLTQLMSLSINDNQLSGTVPTFIGNLTRLRYLHLDSNSFTGALPVSIGTLPDLWYLTLSQNQLTQIPVEFAQLTLLYSTDLSKNQFCNLPPTIVTWANTNDSDWAATQTCPKPDIQIAASPLSGAAPLNVTFTATNIGQSAISSWNWTFGDGSTAATQNTSHTYTTGGTFIAQLIVSGIGGRDTASLSIQVVALPIITTQPANRAVTVGQTATFSIVASGVSLTYQWRKNGTNISGATSTSYTTPATVQADSGSQFSCVVSNAGGSVTSTNALLTVTPIALPVITSQPAHRSVTIGQTATFSVTATGAGTLTYQWRKNGTTISGATTTSYTTPATVQADSGSQFSCVVSNAGGSVTSTNATLTVSTATAPIITTEPQSRWVNEGQAAAFTVVASGNSPFSYQWKKGTTSVGTNSPTLTLSNIAATDAGTYWVVVSNAYGSDTSAQVLLTVLPAGSTYNNQKLSINGELRDENGNLIGVGMPDTVDMTIRLMNRDIAGAPLCIERFRRASSQGVVVNSGLFTARLGEGTTTDNLKQVLANNPHLWVELIIEGQTPDTLRPRTPLTGNGQSIVAGGAQSLHGSGTPGGNLDAVTGTFYINDANGTTWVKTNSGWHLLQ